MRAFVLTLLILPFQLQAQLNHYPDNKNNLSPIKTPRGTLQMSHLGDRSNTVLLFEDFQSADVPEIPDTWDGGPQVEQQQDNNQGIGLGTFVDAWQTGGAYEANNGGYLPVPHFDDNLFVYVNDDGDPCNCDMENVSLTLPEFSFAGLENMIIAFDIYSQSTFGGDNMSLQISTNGTDFITLYTAESSPEWQPAQVDLSLFDDEPTVWLRFTWSDNGNWSSGGAIDNILVAENLEYNVGINRPYVSEYTADWDNESAISGEYSSIPLEQATALVFGAAVQNKGALPMNDVVLTASVYENGTFLGSFNSQIEGTMLPSEQQDFFIYTALVPNTLGEYTVEYELVAADEDEDPVDNFATRTLEYSDFVYAMDDGAADSFRNNSGESFTLGNVFEIPNSGSVCYGIGVGIGAGSAAQTEIEVRLYDTDFLYVTGSEPYTIGLNQMIGLGQGDVVNIPLEEPFLLEEGKSYIAAVTYFATTLSAFTVANSGISQEQFSVFQNEFGDWFFVTTTPMVRMNLSPSVDIQEFAQTGTLSIFPNPVSSSYLVQSKDFENGPASASVVDVSGRELMQRDLHLRSGENLPEPFDLGNLAPGVYHFRIVQDGQHFATRFVVAR